MKKVLILFVVTVFLLSAINVAGAEEQLFVQSEEFDFLETTGIKLLNENGEAVEALNGSETLIASVDVKNNSNDGKALSLIAVLSEKNRVKEVYTYDGTAVAEDITGFVNKFTLPENTEGLALSIMLWDGTEDMKNVCTALRLPVEENAVRIIKADGKAIDGFDEEITGYSIEITKDIKKPLNITALPVDGGTEIMVKPPLYFPGKTLVTALFRDGSKKEYSLNYICNDLLVSDISNSGQLNARYTPVYKKNLSEGDDCFSDKAAGSYSSFTYLDDALKGKDWLCCPANWAVLSSQKKFWNGSSAGSMEMFGFKLSRSASVKVFCESECAVEGSFDEEDGWIKTISDTPYFIRSFDGEEISAGILYEKTFRVTGEEAEVKIENHGGDATYIITLDYLYE